MPLFRRTGKAVDLLYQLRKEPVFKRTKFHVQSSNRKNLKRLVIGIGQVHPVSQGKFSYWTAKKIGDTQAWIFSACRFFTRSFDVFWFGQEGYSTNAIGPVRGRVDEKTLEDIRRFVDDRRTVRQYLLAKAQKWRTALRMRDKPAIASTMNVLNALTLLQAINRKVAVFPIEQKDVHGRIHEGIVVLHEKIDAIEKKPAYQSYRRKDGKGLTKEEYNLARERNSLIKAFNKLLTHPERERSILREVLKHAAGQDITIFILGNAHRRRMLRLAKKHADPDVLFVWMTPPALWWWKAMRKRAWMLFVIGVLIWTGVALFG